MKKYILFAAAALMMASCTKDNSEDTTKSDVLTPVSLGVNTSFGDGAQTRAVWADPTAQADGTYSVHVSFETGEALDLYELGYSGKQVFTCSDAAEYQSGNFSGYWHKDGTRWAAVLPSGSSQTVSMNSDGTNSYNLTLPTNQETVKRTVNDIYGNPSSYTVSPDLNANIMVAGVNLHSTTGCFLAPICSYIYFATTTDITHVKISATNTVNGQNVPIAGNVVVVTGPGDAQGENGEWQTWDEFVTNIKSITPSGSCNEVTVEGKETNRSYSGVKKTFNEYVACVLAGNYTNLTLTDVTPGHTEKVLKKRTGSYTLETVHMYYFGQIDKTEN